MSPTIRPAALSDAEDLARLRWAFAYESGRAREQPFPAFAAEMAAFLQAALASGAWTIWVAEDAGRLVGQLYLQAVPKVPLPGHPPRCWGYVTNVFVEPELRRSGVGTRLLLQAIEASRAAGIEFLILWPAPLSVPWYLRHGFRPSPEGLELSLEL